MSFLENLGATLGSGARVVADKTKEISGIASIKAQVAAAEANLGKLYKDLGKAYYEDNKESAVYGDKMSEIAAVLAKIDGLNEKLATAKKGAEPVIVDDVTETVEKAVEEVKETAEEVVDAVEDAE